MTEAEILRKTDARNRINANALARRQESELIGFESWRWENIFISASQANFAKL